MLARAERPHLVFPSSDAIDAADLEGHSAPGSLVLLDGTWPQARALLREVPELAALPKLKFTPTSPSNYRIRRPPRAEYVSTLESIVEVLTVLEPEAELGQLRALFGRFIDENISARAIGQAPPRRKLRKERPAAVPIGLSDSLEGALVVLAQKSSATSNWEIDSVRIRQRGGVVALPRVSSFAELSQVVRPDEVLVAWSKHTLDQIRAEGVRTVCLKEAFCNHWQRSRSAAAVRPRGLEGALEREGLSGPTPLQASVALWQRLVEIHLG